MIRSPSPVMKGQSIPATEIGGFPCIARALSAGRRSLTAVVGPACRDPAFGLRLPRGGEMLPGQAMRLAVARGSVFPLMASTVPSAAPGGSRQVEEDPGDHPASFGPISRPKPVDALVILTIVTCLTHPRRSS